MTRTYIRVTFVAMSPYGKPIATAHTEKDLKAGLDEYYGIGTDSKAQYLIGLRTILNTHMNLKGLTDTK